jgi:hypothetical protein
MTAMAAILFDLFPIMWSDGASGSLVKTIAYNTVS